MVPLQSGDLIEGQIEKIAFGGEGILRHRGFVVFIPFTAPGDHLICRLTEVKKSFARGELIELKKPSPDRIKPLCPYFGVCGGCQLQHINYKEQSKYKLEAVKEALSRIGHLAPDKVSFVPANLRWAYRRHITLHLRPVKKTFEAGYIAIDNHSLVVVRTCPIFNRFKDPVLRQLQDFIQTIPNPEELEGRLTVLKNHRNQYILHFQFAHHIELTDSLFNQLLY